MTAERDGGKDREPFRSYRERLALLGFRPSSARGQNFLLDPTLHRWIADQAAPGSGDVVVEVGVGLGFLTRELAARAGKVVAIELDGRLLAIAREDLGAVPNIEWVEGDALGGPGRTLRAEFATAGAGCAGRLLVVANLPYSVSGPLLAELVQLERLPERIVVLVQRELGQRLAASAGDSAYGGLSVLGQAVYRVRSLRDVSPGVFRPRPKVWSAVIALDRRDDASPSLGTAAARRSFARFVRALFAQRRKVLRTTYPAAVAAIGAVPIALDEETAGRRAESLVPDQVVDLWGRSRGPSAAADHGR